MKMRQARAANDASHSCARSCLSLKFGAIQPKAASQAAGPNELQDTPGDGYYFVLLYDERPLVEQVETLGLRDGDAVILREPDCGDFTVEAVLLFNFKHPMMPGLWAKAKD